ncbi:MAG TPA: pirin family protein [Flavobacteriales bacterium]
MAFKTIRENYKGTPSYMVGNGFKVSNYIPGIRGYSGNELSPFILLDYNAPHYFEPSVYRRGVGEHPHRGFETVSIAYEGEIEHRDSSGGGGVIQAGDVQWMTAAAGLMHDEFQSENFARSGGVQHFIQLWVNLPAAYKMVAPGYQAITASEIPNVQLDDKGSIVRIIAGNYEGIRGAASSFTPVNMFDFRLQPSSDIMFQSPAGYNSFLLITKGHVCINEELEASHGEMVVFEPDFEDIKLEASEESMIFFAAGQPINEPIERYGPFVMNNKSEILQAIEDIQTGQFGFIAPMEQ